MDSTRFLVWILSLPSLISRMFEPGYFNFHTHRRQHTKDSVSVWTRQVTPWWTAKTRNPARGLDHRLSFKNAIVNCKIKIRGTSILKSSFPYFFFSGTAAVQIESNLFLDDISDHHTLLAF